MASMRDIKRRIKSVNSTEQITNAMYLVASSKLNKARNRLDDTRPFFNETRKVIANIVNGSSGISHPFLEKREVKSRAVIVITGDRGLCGGYNANVNKIAMTAIKNKENDKVIAVGGKGKEFFKSRCNLKEAFTNISERPTYEDALKIGRLALEMFTSGEVDEVYLAYTEFVSTLVSEPKLIKLFPLDVDDFKNEDTPSASALTIYEPGEEEVLEYVIPKYVNTVLYGALVESTVCELGARMTAMDAATENAEEMINSLNIIYNRARQSAITQEITEIVGGSGIYG
ncbi:MAG: ATP synthase F1 subunit gamma [Eubacteriales bacterium]|nr:ATP synthase F1 subunit gamma [Eubacteriales bacterium]